MLSDAQPTGHCEFLSVCQRSLVLLCYSRQVDWWGFGYFESVSLVCIRLLAGCNCKVPSKMLARLEKSKSSS